MTKKLTEAEKKARAKAREQAKAAKPIKVEHLFGRHMLKAHLVGEDKYEHKKILETWQKDYNKAETKALLLKDKIDAYKESIALWKDKVNSAAFINLETSTQESLKNRLAKTEQTLTNAQDEYTKLEKTMSNIGLAGKKLIGETETTYIKKMYLGKNYASVDEYCTPESYDEVVPEGATLTAVLGFEIGEHRTVKRYDDDEPEECLLIGTFGSDDDDDDDDEYSCYTDEEESESVYIQSRGDGTKTVNELIADYINRYGKAFPAGKFVIEKVRYLNEYSIPLTDELRAKTEKKSPREKRMAQALQSVQKH